MLYKRALLAAVALYIGSFVLGMIASYVFRIELELGAPLPLQFALLQAALSFALGFAGGWWYFRSPESMPSLKQGLFVGLVIVAASFVFDFLLFMPALFSGYPLSELMLFYMDTWFWTAIALLVGGTTLAAYFTARKKGAPVL